MRGIDQPLWTVAVALLVILVVGLALGSLARWLLRGRAVLDTSTSIVLAILGSAAGLALAGAVQTSARVRDPLAIALALGFTAAAIAGYSALAAHFQRTLRRFMKASSSFWLMILSSTMSTLIGGTVPSIKPPNAAAGVTAPLDFRKALGDATGAGGVCVFA